jgi:hypothetical protein
MRKLQKLAATLVVSVLLTETMAYAVDSKGASYFGGTVTTFSGAKDPVEGLLDTSKTDQFIFTARDKKFAGKTLIIPYARIIDLEYGQKAGRRVGTAVATTILLGPIGLLSLLSKKRNHFLTIGFKDESGTDQVAVMELGKDIVRTTLQIVETRSGKKIEYQDDEARKEGR